MGIASLTARAVGAAELAGRGVEAVGLAVRGGAGGVASTASLRARGAGAANSLLWLVAGVLAADDAKEVAGRRLHHVRPVGHGLGGDIGGEGEGREGGDGLDEHCDGDGSSDRSRWVSNGLRVQVWSGVVRYL